MSLTQKDYDNIYTAASLGASIGAIATQLGYELSEFMDMFFDPTLEVKRFYDGGRMKAEQEMNAAMLALAKNGSQVAMIQFQRLQMGQNYETLRQSLDEL